MDHVYTENKNEFIERKPMFMIRILSLFSATKQIRTLHQGGFVNYTKSNEVSAERIFVIFQIQFVHIMNLTET